jgi:omega-6 fatty acid desaturase (delta-12 desaturase)
MIYHDLGHHSFFSTAALNEWGEFFLQFIIITPVDWSKKHKMHHGTSGDLNKGPTEWNDTIYITTEEYFALSPTKRKLYRILRDPVFFFSIVPILNWFVKFRVPFVEMLDPAQQGSVFGVAKNSFINTTGSLILFWCISLAFGTHVLWGYVFSMYFCMAIGVIFAHLQHVYNPSYTTREGWNLKDSALKGSSILNLPRILKQWTMGIEYHHIHHYSTIVPGYLLRRCHEEAPEGLWDDVTILSYADIFKSLSYTLFDERTGKYVSFTQAHDFTSKKQT